MLRLSISIAIALVVTLISVSTTLYAQSLDVTVDYDGSYAVFTIVLPDPFTDGNEDNFSLVFDADSDGITDRLISYHANLGSHYPGSYWGMQDERVTCPRGVGCTGPIDDPCLGPLWHSCWEAVPGGWLVSESGLQTFTVGVPYGYLGGPGSEFRYAVWAHKQSTELTPPWTLQYPDGSIFGYWESSEFFARGTIPAGAPPTPTPTPSNGNGGNGEGAGCFIATAAYGSYLDSHVEALRNFRDSYMVTNPVGSALASAYYKLSPPVAEFIENHPTLKPIVRVGLLPAVAMSTVAVNTTSAEKVAMVGSLALVSVALAVWLSRRRGKRIIS